MLTFFGSDFSCATIFGFAIFPKKKVVPQQDRLGNPETMSSSSELGGCEPAAFQRLSRPADLHRALNKAHRLQTRAAAPCRLTQGLQTLGQPPGSAPRPPIHPLLTVAASWAQTFRSLHTSCTWMRTSVPNHQDPPPPCSESALRPLFDFASCPAGRNRPCGAPCCRASFLR